MRLFCSRPASHSKPRRVPLPAALLVFGTALCVAAQAPAGQRIVRQASRVVLSRTGIHTHADFLLFETGSLDIGAMQRDPAHFPGLSVRAHCPLPTDRAALPPDLAAFSAPGGPSLENPYGPIDGGSGKPGWSILPFRKGGKNFIKVLVPTRFANWLALQSPARRKQYLMPRHYTLEVRWGGEAVSALGISPYQNHQ